MTGISIVGAGVGLRVLGGEGTCVGLALSHFDDLLLFFDDLCDYLLS